MSDFCKHCGMQEHNHGPEGRCLGGYVTVFEPIALGDYESQLTALRAENERLKQMLSDLKPGVHCQSNPVAERAMKLADTLDAQAEDLPPSEGYFLHYSA